MEANRADKFLKAIFEATGEHVTMETRILDMPIDSLEFLDMLQKLQLKGFKISDKEAGCAITVGDLAANL